MSRIRLIGRKAECLRLDRCVSEEQAQLVLLYGRRRVGKTYLIDQYFEKRFDFKITGAEKQPKEAQLHIFTQELNRQTQKENGSPSNWTEAFDMLRAYLEGLSYDEKRVVFFDEMPWLDTPRSGFLAAFESFWNSWGYSRDNLVFVVSGSASSWLMKNIDGNKGGLYNRSTAKIYLEPFCLREMEEYLQSRGIEWSRYDIAECYMILGGIPYYLSLLDPEMTYQMNIDNLFFRKRAELSDEFDRLYRALFSNSAQYIRLVEALSSKRRGLSREEIEKKTGLPSNGALTEMLNDLINCGFVRACSYYGQKKKDVLYQLSDYYSLFYFRFIKDNYGRDEHYWSNTLDNPSRKAWAELSFEQLCKDHIPQIKEKLGIAGVLSVESSWYERSTEDGVAKGDGAQIDLVIDRRDRVINICEIKYSINQFEIDKEYDMKLRRKIAAFSNSVKSNKSLQLTMITTYGVKRGKYSGTVNKEVVLDDLFR